MASITRHKSIFIALVVSGVVILSSLSASLAQVAVKPAPTPPRLLADLKSNDAAVRRAGANRLGALRSLGAVRALIDLLADKDAGAREAAAFALGQIADRQAADALIRALADKDAEVRASAAFALGMLGDRKAIEPLSTALTDPEAAVRSAAVVALGLMQDEEAVAELIDLLNDSSFDVRYDAVWALGRIGEPDAQEHLRAVLVGLDSLPVDNSLREAFRQTVQHSLESLRTEDRARAATEAPTRPRRTSEPVNTSPRSYAKTARPVSIQQSARAASTERAARARASGTVELRVLVSVTGRAERAYVTNRVGYGLDQRAVQAIYQYRFDPAMKNGLPQTDWLNVEVRF